MPHFDSYEPGSPCWVDLMSPDVDASKSFYSSVFGWDAKDEHDDEGNRIYTQFSQGGRVVAGLGGQAPGMEGMPALWNSYIATADVAATAAAVEAAGGSVMMPPMPVMDAGAHGPSSPTRPGRRSRSGRPGNTTAPVWRMSPTPGAGTNSSTATSTPPRRSTPTCSAGPTTTRTWVPWAPTP